MPKKVLTPEESMLERANAPAKAKPRTFIDEPSSVQSTSGQSPSLVDALNFHIGNSPKEELFRKTYGDSPLDYKSTFQQGFENLGQPGQVNPDVVANGTYTLANAFADRVYAKTGALPTEDQLRSFIATSLNSGVAQKFIQGVAPDQVNALVDNYLTGNPDVLVTPGMKSAEEQRLGGLVDQFNKIYDTGRQNLVSGYDQTVYGPAKTRATNDLAGQGMLTQPNSRYTLDAIEGARGRDISTGLNTLEGQRAQGSVDLSKTIEDLLQKNRDRSQNAYQFNQSFNAGREDTAFNQGIQRQQLGIADALGRAQAGAGKRDWVDYLNLGLGGLGTAFMGYKAFNK